MIIKKKETNYIYERVLQDPSVSKDEYNETINVEHTTGDRYSSVSDLIDFLLEKNDK